MSRKTAWVSMLLVLALVLSACSGNNTGPSQSGQGQQNNASASSSNESASGQNEQKEPLVLKVGHIAKPDHILNVAAEQIDEELQKRSDGRISLEIYPAGQLGNEADMIQAINTGNLHMGLITTAQLSAHSEAFGAWLLPFIVDNHDDAFELWNSEESMALFDTLTNENLVGLGYVNSGVRTFLMTKDPIRTPEDLKNKKLRVTPSPTILDFYTSLDVSPTPMPLTEVFMSLETGVIDGMDIDNTSIIPESLYKTAKHWTNSNHMYWICGIVMNKDLWNSLSAEDQQIINEAIQAAMQRNLEYTKNLEQEIIDYLKNETDVQFYELDADKFAPYVEEVHNKWAAKSEAIVKFLAKAEEIRDKK